MQYNEQEQQDQLSMEPASEQAEQENEPQSAPVAAQIEQQLATEQRKAEEYLDLLRRTQADFMNYRRRTSQEQAEGRLAAQRALLSRLLPVLDDLERGLKAAPIELASHPWVQGLFLTARRLATQLNQLGVQQIGAPGEQFDPRKHEAILTEARADVPAGTILQVARPGYTLGGHVIRPAQVSVAGEPSPTQDIPAPQDASES